jgi:AcrR family transcriptional regulator
VTTTAIRLTAAERREAVLDAAMAEFAAHGYEGSSTEEIARRAGIAQPYVFRLFGTKRTSSTPPSSAACLS